MEYSLLLPLVLISCCRLNYFQFKSFLKNPPTCFTFQIKTSAATCAAQHYWHKRIFSLLTFPLSPLGLYFHSETSASFQCSSCNHWGILQHHLGPWQHRRLSSVHIARKRKQRLVEGITREKKQQNKNWKWTWETCCSILLSGVRWLPC